MIEKKKAEAWLIALVTVAIITWIGVKTQATANRQETEARTALVFADQTRQCLYELLDSLAARAVIAENSERINNDQHKALTDLVSAVTAAPDDAARTAVLARIFPAVIQAQQRQEALALARAEHPLPDPACPLTEGP